MPLSWNEIKSRSLAFSKEWENEISEDAEAKSFWDGFFHIFGISRKRVASFEEPVKKLGDKQGFIDLFWKGVLLVEHKSRGKNLERAYTQALDYFPGIAERDLPKYVLVSDFARFRLFDLEENEQHEFELKDLHKNVRLFGFIAGYQTHKIQDQDPVNIKAAERMGKLHDQMKAVGYEGHPLELYLVRLLFCLFAEDTGIFERQQFQEYIEQRTGDDGSDLAHHLNTLFQILNTPEPKRLKNLDEQLNGFPYVNGKLFEEMLPTASFDSAMRQSLLDCCALDWSRISPAIFGSLFQSIMNKEARRNLGAHYTSEKNILKLIKPLFLDGLWEEFEKIKSNKNKLYEFHGKLRTLKFLDPACGCGNFLVIAYRELRILELAVLRASKDSKQQSFDVHSLIQLDVDQFFGIEIEEFPAQIAQVALWLMDHQMNLQVSEEFGLYFARIPLRASSTIVCANALRLDWNDVVPAAQLSYIMGNPPFLGKKEQSTEQKAEVLEFFKGVKDAGILDYVACWYIKASGMMEINREITSAFVSTKSITHGEQVSPLWHRLIEKDIQIHFAHQTFKWSSEGKGKAAVHVVIIGFGFTKIKKCNLFVYDNVSADPTHIVVSTINPYLIEAPNVLIGNRSKPILPMPTIIEGITPLDNGLMSFSHEEYVDFIKKEPEAKPWFKKWVTGDSYINNYEMHCLWMPNISPKEIRSLPYIKEITEKVREFRLHSKSSQKFATTPWLLRETTIPYSYIIIPKTSSETRQYVPIGFISDAITSSSSLILKTKDLFIFGVMLSIMHMAWMRSVGGRLESRFRYSAGIVYNNFPWPENPSERQKQAIETAAQGVLDARLQFPDSSLADLYDPLTMPPVLLKAHQTLDKAVDAAYGKTTFKTEAERVAFLFELYQKYTSLLPVEKAKKKK